MRLPVILRPHLLVAEDDVGILDLVQALLSEEGYVIATADSLAASLAAVEAQPFHFILTDLFPQRGQPPLQSIQPLLSRAAPTPIGIITGWQITPEAAAQAGLSWLLPKPFDIDELLQAVRTSLQPPVTPKQQQVQIIEQFFAAINARDWDTLACLCTPDVVFMTLAAPSTPTPSPQHGLDTYLAAITSRVLALPGFTIEEVAVFARPFGLMARYTASWQGSDGPHQVAGAMRFRFQGERIAQLGW